MPLRHTGYDCNDQMHSEKGKVVFDSNNAGGITGGVTTGQDIVIRVAVKPTPTIDREQHTIDKYTLENKALAAITRRDPTIVARIWPVAENLTALILLDNRRPISATRNCWDCITSLPPK